MSRLIMHGSFVLKHVTFEHKRLFTCKNSSSCLFLKSNSCEFLHSEAWEEQIRNDEVETLQMMNNGQRKRLSDLEENSQGLENSQLKK